ncbi:hypothetical protein [Streptomyces sp. NPDC001530]|uniref:hypothetical protein n=1 Tax=Streptomyces sp. NPDC001530 TaxID=3364582 RepID=UPI00367B581C
MSTATPTHLTAPLPPAAAEALSRLELAFAPLPVRKAVVRYGICLETYARLAMMDARNMSGYQFDLMVEAQDELTQRHEQLEQAGMLHLVVTA